MPQDGIDMSDHDLLIRVSSSLDQIKTSLDAITPVINSLNSRLAVLEEASARHSERITTVRGIVDTLKLEKLNKVEIDSLREDIDDLQKKSNTWDILNSIAIGVAAVLGVVFRK